MDGNIKKTNKNKYNRVSNIAVTIAHCGKTSKNTQ